MAANMRPEDLAAAQAAAGAGMPMRMGGGGGGGDGGGGGRGDGATAAAGPRPIDLSNMPQVSPEMHKQMVCSPTPLKCIKSNSTWSILPPPCNALADGPSSHASNAPSSHVSPVPLQCTSRGPS